MKTKQTTLDPNNNVELYIPTNLNESGMFVITGTYDDVTDIATNYDLGNAPETAPKARKPVVAPQVVTSAITASKSIVEELKAKALLETKIAVYDLIHGTNYRTIRKSLLDQQRDDAFLASIGLERK